MASTIGKPGSSKGLDGEGITVIPVSDLALDEVTMDFSPRISVRILLKRAQGKMRSVFWQARTIDDALLLIGQLRDQHISAVRVRATEPDVLAKYLEQETRRVPCSDCEVTGFVFDVNQLNWMLVTASLLVGSVLAAVLLYRHRLRGVGQQSSHQTISAPIPGSSQRRQFPDIAKPGSVQTQERSKNLFREFWLLWVLLTGGSVITQLVISGPHPGAAYIAGRSAGMLIVPALLVAIPSLLYRLIFGKVSSKEFMAMYAVAWLIVVSGWVLATS